MASKEGSKFDIGCFLSLGLAFNTKIDIKSLHDKEELEIIPTGIFSVEPKLKISLDVTIDLSVIKGVFNGSGEV